MADLLKALGETPLAVILVLAGILLLVFALVPFKIHVKSLSTGTTTVQRQIVAGIIGGLLVVGGIYMAQTSATPASPSKATTAPDKTTVPTVQPEPTNPQPPASVAPSPVPAATEPPPTEQSSIPSIAISEVMASPCTAKGKGTGGPSSNEYIELYNYGSVSVDVAGWWIGTNAGDPQKIVAWDTRFPNTAPENSQVLTKTTVIPPLRFALVMAPLYLTGDPGNRQPYVLPNGTIILTTMQGQYLGSDRTGLLGTSKPLTVVLLYQGTQTDIALPVSTYGTPKFSSNPNSIADDGQDLIPIPAQDCHSVSRIMLSGPDSADNWQMVNNGSPGKP